VSRRLIINGDDYGISTGVCDAIDELIRSGSVSNTTIMIAADGARDRCQRRDLLLLRPVAGVHLQLTNGAPVAPPDLVPSLVDTNGRFRSNLELGPRRIDHIEAEWRSQIECITEMLGGTPTHLDSHHGFHRHRALIDIYLGLAEEYGLTVRGGEKIWPAIKDSPVSGSRFSAPGWSGKCTGLADLQIRLLQALERAGPDDVVELASHPGSSDDYLRQVSSLADARECDLRDLRELHSSGWLAERSIHLVRHPTAFQ
jgi:predicted glycoside hydrolase/deacetylase ChbG (UPF0249 family)